jgi:hypothetical protein
MFSFYEANKNDLLSKKMISIATRILYDLFNKLYAWITLLFSFYEVSC